MKRGFIVLLKLRLRTKVHKTHDNGLSRVSPTKQCFGNALPKTIWNPVSRQFC